MIHRILALATVEIASFAILLQGGAADVQWAADLGKIVAGSMLSGGIIYYVLKTAVDTWVKNQELARQEDREERERHHKIEDARHNENLAEIARLREQHREDMRQAREDCQLQVERERYWVEVMREAAREEIRKLAEEGAARANSTRMVQSSISREEGHSE